MTQELPKPNMRVAAQLAALSGQYAAVTAQMIALEKEKNRIEAEGQALAEKLYTPDTEQP